VGWSPAQVAPITKVMGAKMRRLWLCVLLPEPCEGVNWLRTTSKLLMHLAPFDF